MTVYIFSQKVNYICKSAHLFYFKGFSKLLICGGYTISGSSDQCEAIDLKSNKTCRNSPQFLTKFNGAIGGIGVTKDPIICGGEQSAIRLICAIL